MIRVLSLGAGVQSTTLALMLNKASVDCAIFADTGWEPKRVYAHLDWLEKQLDYPVYRVSAGNLREHTLARSNTTGGRFAAVPWFMSNGGIGRRQCTKEYKLRPIQRKVRELLGSGRNKGGCSMLIGISMDEAIRRKPSLVGYIVNRWPLLEWGMNRRDCLAWMKERGFPIPGKSACIGCPYHDDNAWRDLRDNSPAEWQDALEVDAAIRQQPKTNAQQFMHRSLKPLAEVDLRTHDEIGQGDLFGNECEGMCGV